jgi:coenzyme PQQ precursor peptide PqqA
LDGPPLARGGRADIAIVTHGKARRASVGAESHENRETDLRLWRKRRRARYGTMRAEAASAASIINSQEQAMAWTKPTFVDIRYGFEITMYIANR